MAEFRPIGPGTFAAVERPASFGPAPQLQWIAITAMVVDDRYQRPLDGQTSRKNVRAIAAGFDWRRFAPLVVSPLPSPDRTCSSRRCSPTCTNDCRTRPERRHEPRRQPAFRADGGGPHPAQQRRRQPDAGRDRTAGARR